MTKRKSLNDITYRETGLQSVPISMIVLGAFQPRQYFDREKIDDLATTIKKHGILEPLIVRWIRESNKYELIAGERRYRAAKEAQLDSVPIIVKELTDVEAVEVALLDNIQREDLNPLEETLGILQLLEIRLGESSQQNVVSLLYKLHNSQKKKSTHNIVGKSQQDVINTVFNELGQLKVKSFIQHRLPLLTLPEEIFQALKQGKIAYTKAKVIAKIKDLSQRNTLLEQAIRENLSLTQIKNKINLLQPSVEIMEPTLRQKGSQLFQRLNSSKIWEHPQKQTQLDNILQQLEALLENS